MAISTTIIGRETLPDSRILEYGVRDPVTGQRYERVLPAPTAPTLVTPTPTIAERQPTIPYWEQKAKELETAGKTEEARWYRIRRPSIPGATPFGIAQPVTPIPAEELEEKPPITVPQQPPPTDATQSVSNIFTSSAGTVSTIQDLKDKVAKVEESVKTTQTTLLEKMKETITGKPTIDMKAELDKAYKEWGIPEQWDKIKALAPEIASIREQIGALNLREQNRLIEAERRGMPMEYIRGEQDLVQRQYAAERAGLSAELGAKAALVEAYQGNISTARAFVSDTVNALTYNITQQRQDMDALYTYYGTELSTLTATQQNEINRLYSDLATEETRQRQDYLAKLNYITTAAGQGVDLGLTITDIQTLPLEEVAKKYAEGMVARPAEDIKALMAKYPTAGITLTDTYEEAIAKVAAIPEEVRAPERVTVEGVVYERDPTTGAWKPAVGIPKPAEMPTEYWAKEYMAGRITMGNIPDNIRTQVLEYIYAPRNYSDSELKTFISNMKTGVKTEGNPEGKEYPYDEVLAEIATDESLLNKDRARELAAGIYGIVLPEVKPKLTPEMKEKVRRGEMVIDLETGRLVTPEELEKLEREGIGIPEYYRPGYMLGGEAIPEFSTPLYE